MQTSITSYFSKVSPTYAFLSVAPELSTFDTIPHLKIASNNPGLGYCGYAALSMVMYNDYKRAVEIRAQVPHFYASRDVEQRTALFNSIRRDETEGADINTPLENLWDLDPTYMDTFARFPEILTAQPGQPDPTLPNGHLADMTSAHLHVAARLYNLRVVAYSHTNTGYTTNIYNMSGTHQVSLWHSHNHWHNHWQALVAAPEPASPDIIHIDSDEPDSAVNGSDASIELVTSPEVSIAEKSEKKDEKEQVTAIPQEGTSPLGSWTMATAGVNLMSLSSLMPVLASLSDIRMPSERKLKKLESFPLAPAPIGGFYVRIVRFSGPRKKGFNWAQFLSAEVEAARRFLETNLGLGIEVGKIRIIVIQGKAIQDEADDLLRDVNLEVTQMDLLVRKRLEALQLKGVRLDEESVDKSRSSVACCTVAWRRGKPVI